MYYLSFYVGQELGEGTVGIAFPYSILTGASAKKTQKFRGNSAVGNRKYLLRSSLIYLVVNAISWDLSWGYFFSSWGESGVYPLVTVHGFLVAMVSLVAQHGLQCS